MYNTKYSLIMFKISSLTCFFLSFLIWFFEVFLLKTDIKDTSCVELLIAGCLLGIFCNQLLLISSNTAVINAIRILVESRKNQ